MGAFYSRAAWGARPPSASPAGWADGKPTSTTIHWNGGLHIPIADAYFATVRSIQNDNMNEGKSDIEYNFLVDRNGHIYEGRGWDARSAAQLQANAHSLAVCYIGGPSGPPLTYEAKQSMKWLAGIPGGPTYPHSHWTPTACPGDEIRTWLFFGMPLPPLPVPQPPKPNEDDMGERGNAVDVALNPNDPRQGITLDRRGGLHAFGGAPRPLGGPYWREYDVARRVIVVDWKKPAGYVMDLYGALHPFGGAPKLEGVPHFQGVPDPKPY